MPTPSERPGLIVVPRASTHRWLTPAACLLLGLAMLVALWVGDEPGAGVRSLGLMALLAAAFAFGGRRSETLAALGGARRDERWRGIDVRATALAGTATGLVTLGAWLLDVARGGDGSPYFGLLAIGGVAYLAAVLILGRRG